MTTSDNDHRKGTIEFDTDTDPKRLDLIHRSPEEVNGVTLVVIYRLDSDTLTYLFARPEDGRLLARASSSLGGATWS